MVGTESVEGVVLADVLSVEMSVELIDLTRDTGVTAVDTFEFLSEVQSPVEIGPVEIKDATA